MDKSYSSKWSGSEFQADSCLGFWPFLGNRHYRGSMDTTGFFSHSKHYVMQCIQYDIEIFSTADIILELMLH